MKEIDVLTLGIPAEMIQNWGWFLAFGIALMVLGFLAVARSVKATVISMEFFGWMLALAGGIEVAQAFMVGKWAGFFLHALAAALYIVTGVVFIRKPVISAEFATLFMSMFFLMAGLFELISSLVTHLHGWGWHALDGVVTFVLGVLLLAQWPITGLWAIGCFVGIDLLFFGWAWVALALDLHKT
ncbi:MAG TPA: HdeD family acid-resistance protein [Opitutaceae bacterium]|nr:HdeD family acid-resistance protein [Opitutaceae bacterium]